MSDEKPLSKSDVNSLVQETEIKPISVDAENSDLAEENPVIREAAMPESSSAVPDILPSEKSFSHESKTHNQNRELTNGAIADKSETPSLDSETPNNANSLATNSIVSEIKALIGTLQKEVRGLTEAMEYTKTFTTNQKSQIDALYGENRKYMEDIIGRFKEKLALAIVEQLDIVDDRTALYKNNEISQEDFVAFCCDLADDFRDILQNRLDIEYLAAMPGDDTKSKEHKILRRHLTDDPLLNKKIKLVKRYGYKNEAGKIIRPVLVETYEYVVPPSLEKQSEPFADETTSPG